jgi:hypothetical protein
MTASLRRSPSTAPTARSGWTSTTHIPARPDRRTPDRLRRPGSRARHPPAPSSPLRSGRRRIRSDRSSRRPRHHLRRRRNTETGCTHRAPVHRQSPPENLRRSGSSTPFHRRIRQRSSNRARRPSQGRTLAPLRNRKHTGMPRTRCRSLPGSGRLRLRLSRKRRDPRRSARDHRRCSQRRCTRPARTPQKAARLAGGET